MTNADIICTILSETTGRPASTFWRILARIPAHKRGNLDAQCPDHEAVLATLRSERGGILSWLVLGAAIERGYTP
jgi:hypothetical protein